MDLYHEIVKVLNDHKLIDCESFERRYRTFTGAPLSPGFYIVTWPEGVEPGDYEESASFTGPFKIPLHAKLAIANEVLRSQMNDRARRA